MTIEHDDDDEPISVPELEQLARSLMMDGSLARRDGQRVASALRELAQRRALMHWAASEVT